MNKEQEKIFQCNQIIAQFMGWDAEKLRIYLTLTPNMGKVSYNERWDLLMPVIEKIESLPTNKEDGEQYQFSITGDGIAITKYDDGSGVISSKVNEIGKSKLMSTFEVVSNFCCDYYKVERRF
jgi:hypothetical protein